MEYRTTDEIVDDMLSYIVSLMPKATQLEKKQVQRQIKNRVYSWIFLQTFATARILKQYQDKIEWLEKQLDYETADDSTLERVGNNKNIVRLKENASTVIVYFCVSTLPEFGNDIVIPKLTEVSTLPPKVVKFRTKENGRIDYNAEWIPELNAYGIGLLCESIEKGNDTLIEAESIKHLISTIPEIEFITNLEISTGGRDIEPRDAYLERLRTQNVNLQQGQPQWWNEELLRFPFVRKGIPVEAERGNGTTTLYVAGYPYVSVSEKQELSGHFNSDDMRRGGGWNILFDDIVEHNIDIVLKVYGSLTSANFNLIHRAAQEYFDLLNIDQEFYVNDFIAWIKKVDGVTDVEVIMPDVRRVVIGGFQIAYLHNLTVSEWIIE